MCVCVYRIGVCVEKCVCRGGVCLEVVCVWMDGGYVW